MTSVISLPSGTRIWLVADTVAPRRAWHRRAGPGQLARVLTSEYAEHTPLNRRSEIYERQGGTLSRSLPSGWVDACCQLLSPRNVLTDGRLHADDPPVLLTGRGKIYDVHVRTPSYTTTKALPLLNALEGWLREKQKTLPRHSERAKVFAYAPNQWNALQYYAGDGRAEPDNNIAEDALPTVSLGRKNYLFFGSNHEGNRGVQLNGEIGSCRLNGIAPEGYPRHVLSVIADGPVSGVGELLPWYVTLPGE